MEKKVLLIADDDEMNRRIICKFLKDNYDVIEAADGRAALTLLLDGRVDVVLLDIIMPEMDGLEVLKELKQHPELDNVGVLVATSTKEKTERIALDLGADDIVSKPYDPIVIKKRLHNILAMKAANRSLDLRQNADVDTQVHERMEAARQQLQQQTDEIRRCATLIAASKENPALVEEMAADILRRANAIDAAAAAEQ